MVTRPPACGRQARMPGEGTRAKLNEWLLAATVGVAGAAEAAVRLSETASADPAATVPTPAQRERRRRCLITVMNGLPCG